MIHVSFYCFSHHFHNSNANTAKILSAIRETIKIRKFTDWLLFFGMPVFCDFRVKKLKAPFSLGDSVSALCLPSALLLLKMCFHFLLFYWSLCQHVYNRILAYSLSYTFQKPNYAHSEFLYTISMNKAVWSIFSTLTFRIMFFSSFFFPLKWVKFILLKLALQGAVI